MKILHIIPSLRKGGAERLVLDVCLSLNQLPNVEVKLVVFRNENDYTFLSDNIDYAVVPAKVLPSISRKTVIETSALKRLIEEYQPDIIHSHLFEAEMVSRHCLYSKAKYFTHFHNNIPQLRNVSMSIFTSKTIFTDFYEKQLLFRQYRRCNNTFIAVSKNGYDYAQDVLPRNANIVLLPNAIDWSRYAHVSKEKPSSYYRIIMIGSLIAVKDYPLALEIINILARRGMPIKVHILGDGILRNELEAVTLARAITDVVTFHGKQDYPEEYLSGSHLFMHTSISESFGLVLVEAMAAGLPVVCTDAGGNRDLIEEGKNGFLLPDRDPEKFADKVEYLLAHPEERERMGKYAQEFSKQYDIKAYVDKLLSIYEQ